MSTSAFQKWPKIGHFFRTRSILVDNPLKSLPNPQVVKNWPLWPIFGHFVLETWMRPKIPSHFPEDHLENPLSPATILFLPGLPSGEAASARPALLPLQVNISNLTGRWRHRPIQATYTPRRPKTAAPSLPKIVPSADCSSWTFTSGTSDPQCRVFVDSGTHALRQRVGQAPVEVKTLGRAVRRDQDGQRCIEVRRRYGRGRYQRGRRVADREHSLPSEDSTALRVHGHAVPNPWSLDVFSMERPPGDGSADH